MNTRHIVLAVVLGIGITVTIAATVISYQARQVSRAAQQEIHQVGDNIEDKLDKGATKTKELYEKEKRKYSEWQRRDK